MSGVKFGKYIPGPLPAEADQLSIFIQKELYDIAQALSGLVTDYVIYEVLYAEPNKVHEGMIVNADGTTWDPGSGAGIYIYRGGSWVLLG